MNCEIKPFDFVTVFFLDFFPLCLKYNKLIYRNNARITYHNINEYIEDNCKIHSVYFYHPNALIIKLHKVMSLKLNSAKFVSGQVFSSSKSPFHFFGDPE